MAETWVVMALHMTRAFQAAWCSDLIWAVSCTCAQAWVVGRHRNLSVHTRPKNRQGWAVSRRFGSIIAIRRVHMRRPSTSQWQTLEPSMIMSARAKVVCLEAAAESVG